MKKCFLTILLTLVMAFAVLPIPALADGDLTPVPLDPSDYSINQGVLTIKDGVTSIGAMAFSGHSELTGVVIPDSVTQIGPKAFEKCTGLKSVTIPSRVSAIEWNAFSGCTSLSSVTIPNGVTRIENYAFEGCTSLTSVTIPASVSSLDPNAFPNCTALTEILVDPENETYFSEEGVVFKTIPSSFRMLSLVIYPCGRQGAYTIPDDVTSIHFTGCTGLTSVSIPGSVKWIDGEAFMGCTNLTSVGIPSSVTKIGENAFVRCPNLKDVYYAGTEAEWNAISAAYREAFYVSDEWKDALSTAVIHYSAVLPEQSSPSAPVGDTPANNMKVTPTASTVLVNGVNVAFDAYNINGANYFKLRDLAMALNGSAKQFEVSWDASANAISLTSGTAYTAVGGELAVGNGEIESFRPTDSKIILDGGEISLEAFNINGNNYFKLRDIGSAFDFGVDWDGANNTVVIDTAKGYTPD